MTLPGRTPTFAEVAATLFLITMVGIALLTAIQIVQ
jgi:hypothetical protein